MLKDYQINIFARVVIRRNKEENKSYDEILETYPLLTPEGQLPHLIEGGACD